MARELSFLISDFRKKLQEAINNCADRGITIEPYCTLITPREQACLWRQGRTTAEADVKAAALDKAGALFLANTMRNSVANATNVVTNLLPGYSWHQWSEAASCVWVDSLRRINWSSRWTDKTGMNGYVILAEECGKAGLTHGSTFANDDKSYTHVQYRPQQSPEEVYSLLEVDAEMAKRFV